MNKPKISIIMGVFNSKSTDLLKKSIYSIINQSYVNWELLICNDGSTDDTLEILKDIEKFDSRIKIIGYENNRGLNYALNYCIQQAKGEYIARQDDDDESEQQRLDCQVKFLDEYKKFHIVGSNATIVDDNGIIGEYKVPEQPQIKDFLWNSPFIHPSVMIRASAINEAGGYRIAKETSRCEDYDLWMTMYSMGFIGYNIQSNLYRYRMIHNPNKKYRSMKDRLNEAKVRAIGYHKLGILWKSLIYVVKPIMVGLIPSKLFVKIKSKQYYL